MSLSRPDRWPCLPVYRFYRLHVCCSPGVRWMSLVSECRPHVSPPIDPPLLPRSLSVNESPLPDSDEACHSCHSCHPPPPEKRLELSPSSLVTGCTILHTRSKWILMAPICFTAPTTNLLSLFTSLLKLQLSRIWKCNHKRHCFFCEQIFFLGCLLAELYNFSLVILSGVNLQNLKLNKSAKFIKKQLFKAYIPWIINQCSG